VDLLTDGPIGAAVILGVLAPWIIAVVNRPAWSSTVRSTVAVVVSVALGLALAAAAGTFDAGLVDVLGTCATVLATSQAVYGRLFAGSQRAVELATSGRGGAHHDVDGDGRADGA
jgi:hypothetical protein